ncbi:P-loop containing nucleoside triphosphate hydrolase protein [Mycena sp. CBHHK59/15]|nr:P-loop containing nucleoside triphosphate hydrolase protein [Mycena sp. CBHHK59/15]
MSVNFAAVHDMISNLLADIDTSIDKQSRVSSQSSSAPIIISTADSLGKFATALSTLVPMLDRHLHDLEIVPSHRPTGTTTSGGATPGAGTSTSQPADLYLCWEHGYCFALVRKILLTALPTFEPHHYQMDSICKVVDGVDLVAGTPTGSGKTGYLFLSIIVMIAIARTPSLCPSAKFPVDPAIVVVCPTNSIEQQMENMAKIGVAALTINSDTVAASRLCNIDLWNSAREGISMLIHGPEQLISKGFRDLLVFEPFYDRVCALGVDEIHLLVYWGLTFRKPFAQIGHTRSQFRPGIPIIGLTATLLGDPKVQDTIFALLGRSKFASGSTAQYSFHVGKRRCHFLCVGIPCTQINDDP